MINTRTLTIQSGFLYIIALFFISNQLPVLCSNNQPALEQKFDVELPQADENASRKKRMRKSSKKKSASNTQKRAETYLDMEYEQLIRAKDAQKAKHNNTATIKYLEQLLKIGTDITFVAEHLLELADTLFADKQLQKAGLVYTQYCSLYPGSEKKEYALYRSLECSFSCILSFDRDQTKTEETLALTELFLIQEHFTTYRTEVMHIQQQCYAQLAASECNICKFYLDRGKIKAAEKRIQKIRSSWLPTLPTLEPEIISLETQLNEQKEMIELLNSKNMQLAQNKTKSMIDRF